MSRQTLLLVGVLLALSASDLDAQYTDDVAVGARVRVWPGPHNAWFVGTLMRATTDSLYIQPCGTCPAKPIARFHVTHVNVSEGRERFNWGHAGRGFAIAGTVGGIVGYMVGSEADRGCDFLCFATGTFTVSGAFLGGVTGLLVGGFAGGEKWK
jgi:hypothetical protein